MHRDRTLYVLFFSLASASVYANDDYAFSFSTAPYVPLADPIEVVTDDEFNGDYRYVPIGFDFQYWDEGHTIFTFNTHGYCAFGLSPNYGFYPFNLGLMGIGDSRVGYVQDGTGGPGHGILKVEWNHVGFLSSPNGADHVSWQVWLYEGTNVVELHFGPSAIAANHFADIFGSVNGPQMEFIHPQAEGYYDLEGLADSPAAIYMPGEDLFLHGFPEEGMVYRYAPLASNGMAEVAATARALVLYPQPAVNVLNVAHADGTAVVAQYAIINAMGIVVQEGRTTTGGINVEHLGNGAYLLRTADGDRTRQDRFLHIAR